MALLSACAESKEERILPLISKETRAKHANSTRIDNVPRVYAEMSGEELDQRTCALIEERFRFAPSRDGDGRPVRSIIEESHTWEAEGGRDPPSEP